jgi:hypothetical protein
MMQAVNWSVFLVICGFWCVILKEWSPPLRCALVILIRFGEVVVQRSKQSQCLAFGASNWPPMDAAVSQNG